MGWGCEASGAPDPAPLPFLCSHPCSPCRGKAYFSCGCAGTLAISTPHSNVEHLLVTHLTGSRALEGEGKVLTGWALPPSERSSFCFLHQLIEGNACSFLALPLWLATSLSDPSPQPHLSQGGIRGPDSHQLCPGE